MNNKIPFATESRFICRYDEDIMVRKTGNETLGVEQVVMKTGRKNSRFWALHFKEDFKDLKRLKSGMISSNLLMD